MKYKWYDFEPFLIINNGGNFSDIRLFNKNINMKIGKKFCTGYFKDGNYVSCPNKTELVDGHQCNECKINDDFFYCIKCDGTECINEKSREECKNKNYFVYLAAFGHVLKVGISFERRIFERLIEQGADFGAKICFVKDGKNVRVVEQQIKNRLNIVDRLGGEEKHSTMFTDPNKAVMNIFNAINELKNIGLNHYLIKPEIYDLRGYYRLENVFFDPKNLKVKDGMEIGGRVVAAKGNLIIFVSNDNFYSVNAHRLYGREILNLDVGN
jgi:hypothetical protein